ncbi:hypothetical protein [Rickettsia endosymbiont of Orchestes rusci]|uniref:hypothetical protein n=1 Tax=Rickettsia endosymbiont of Orchestes rusci TaxID=3066250 RepID=UPI00313EA11F
MSFPQKRESRLSHLVMLNLFQHLLGLLHGSRKVPYVILAKGGNLEKILLSHPEFISGYTTRDAETSSA